MLLRPGWENPCPCRALPLRSVKNTIEAFSYGFSFAGG
jgi:hypothetical protein